MLLSEIISPREEVKEAQLNEALPFLLIPALAMAIRIGVPAIARAVSTGGKVAAKTAIKNPKKTAVAAAAAANPSTTMDVINTAAKVYNVVKDPKAAAAAMAKDQWGDVGEAAMDIAAIVAGALPLDVVKSLAAAAVKNALPIAGVVAMLYGGKKLYDYMTSETPPVAPAPVKKDKDTEDKDMKEANVASSPEDVFYKKQIKNIINTEMENVLTPIQKEALIMWLDGATFKQIAQHFDKSTSRANMIVYQALRLLKRSKHIKKLKQTGFGAFDTREDAAVTAEDLEEGWKSKLAGAAMMGLGALGATGGQASAADHGPGAKAPIQTTQAAQNITKVKRYPTDPRQELTLGSPADLFFNGDEKARKMRYLDYQTNPDFDPKTTPPSQAKMQGTNKPYVDQGQQLTPDQKAARDKLPLRSANWHPDDDKTKEDAAGVGIITKQNTTGDVNKGSIRKNLKAFKL